MGRLTVCLLLVLSMAWIAPRPAEAFILNGWEEILIKAHEFPDTDEYRSKRHDSHMDLGYLFKQQVFLGMPIWASPQGWVLLIKNKPDAFIRLEGDDKDLFLEQAGNPPVPKLPFTSQYLGWVVFGPLLLLGAYRKFAPQA